MGIIEKKFREWYADKVIGNPAAQDVLLKGWRRVQSAWCWTRGSLRSLAPGSFPHRNIYHAAVQKTGSHWIKAVFSDPRVRARTGMPLYPGHRYEWDEFHKRFPPRHMVPALFISYGQYEEIRKPGSYRTFYVMRDPREIVVSWYFSALESHRLAGKVPRFRAELKKRNREDGIDYAIRHLSYKFAFMRSWAYHAEDPYVLMVKFEDLVSDPVRGLGRVFEHCDIAFSEEELRELAGDYSKEAMRAREEERPFLTRRSTGESSHYRSDSGNWREVFTDRNYEHFLKVNGNLLEVLGYE